MPARPASLNDERVIVAGAPRSGQRPWQVMPAANAAVTQGTGTAGAPCATVVQFEAFLD
jgi:hypothetical protein